MRFEEFGSPLARRETIQSDEIGAGAAVVGVGSGPR
jgi:hypothetical protein